MIRILLFLFLIMGITLEIKAQWSTSNLSQAKDYFSATSSGNKVFFAGGELGSSRSNVVDIYDISTNSWTTATLSQARRSVASVALGTKVFFAGGYLGATSTNVVDIYDTSTDTWSTATLSEARNSLAAAAVGTKVFFAGGTNSSSVRSNVVDIYDNSTNTWSTASLSVARDDLSATSVGNKVFFAGGNTGGGASDVVDIYDNSTNTWSTATLSAGRFDLRATSAGTKAFFAGGNGGAFRSTRVDVYDNSTGLWTLIMLSQGRDRLSASTLGNQVFFAGGASSSSAKSNVVDIYDITTNTWSTAALSLARDNLASASAGNKIFFGGGYDGTARSNVVDIYSGSVLEPTSQPTNLIFSPVGHEEMTLNYTTAIGNPDGYIILRKQGSASTAIPGDGITYAQSDVIGDAEVVYSGNNLTFNDTDLSDGTVYYYRIFSYNGSGGSINYLTPSPLSGNQTTGTLGQYFSRQNGNWNAPATWSVIGPAGPPATGVPAGSSGENVNISAGTTVTATGTMELGGGVIEIKPGGTLNAAGNDFDIFGSLIIDGTLLNAGSVIGSGSISSAGPAFPVFDQIIYGGTSPGSGISLDNTDVVALGGASPADGTSVLDLNGFILYPCIPPLNSTLASTPLFTNLNGTSMTLSWTNPVSGTDGVMVVARAGGSLIKPVPGNAYSANSIFGQGSETETGSLNYIVYQGTGNTVTITGLTPNTVYTFGIYQLNGSSCYNKRTMLEPSQNSGNNPAPILTFNPLNAATNVSVSGNITITTSEAIRKLDNSPITASDLATLVELKLTNNAGAAVPFSATIDGTRTVITIDPTSNLLSNTIYYVELNPVEDIDNIATSAQSITFTTADATPPLVTFLPINAATNINNATNITLTFSEAIRNLDNTAVTNANVSALITLKLTNASGANIPFTATINGAKNIITIDPTNALADLSDVYVAVSNVEDNSDNALSPSPQSITFTTGDMTPPTATFSPLNGATNVSVGANILVTFNEPVQHVGGAPITSANAADLFIFKLTNASGASVPFTATINGSNTIITIDPVSSLLPNQIYFLRYDVVQDAAGNITTTGNIIFTTQTGPSITNVSPVSVCLGQPITITGTNFGATLPTVSINGVNIPVTAHSSTSITILPSSAASGVITVTNTEVSLSAVSSSSITTSASPNVFAVTGGGSYCAGDNGVTIGLSNSQSGVEYEVYLGVTATGRKLTPGGGAFNFTGLFTAAGTYSVKGKNAGNCSSDMSGAAVVQVNNIPSGTGSITSSTTAICQDGSVDLTAIGFVNGLTFEWTLPAGLTATSSTSGSTINVRGDATPGGTVSVVARNNCGLSNPATLAIMVNPKPVVSIEISPADQQIVNEAVLFTAVVDMPVSPPYTWSFGDGDSSSDENPEHTYTDVGDFSVSLMVQTNAGCEGLAEETFSIKEFSSLSTTAIKNVVTANNDGKNDRLIVVNIDRFPNNTLSVLDRWGVEVYKQDAYNNDWDFKKGGNYLPAGNYICIVKLNDSGTIITRTVTLVKK